jgi:hypothetical protein
LITLGVNATTDQAFLAVVDDETVVDVEPTSLRLAHGLPPGRQLLALRDETARLIRAESVQRVRILNAEPSRFNTSYTSLIPRLTLESIIALAAAELEIDCDRRTRASLRSIFGLPREGSLASHVGSVLMPTGRSWTNKRDLAALAALAGNRE